MAPEQIHRRQAALARQVPPVAMQIELPVVPDCPNDAAAAELMTTAVADTGAKATITHTIIGQRGPTAAAWLHGSPTILLNSRKASRQLPWADVATSAGVVNRLSAALRLDDDCGHGLDPTSRHVHRGRQAVGRRPA